MYDVFVCYSSKDKVVADAMVHVLEEHGIRCWIAPRNILPGSDYADAIDSAIKEVKVVVFVHSKDSLGSKWCKSEVNLAVSNEKIIVPFKIDDALATGGWNLYFANSHWIDAVPEPKKKFGEIARSVLSLMGRKASSEENDVEEAENVFLGRVRRFKNNDGKIDDEELGKLIGLADRLGITPIRREELIARIEDEFEDAHQGGTVSVGEAPKPEGKKADAKSEDAKPEEAKSADAVNLTDDFSDLIVRLFDEIGACDKLYVHDIPARKLTGARAIMAPWAPKAWAQNERVLVVCDTTAFGGAGDGLVVTKEAVYFKNLMGHSHRIAWTEVNGVTQRGEYIVISGQMFYAGLLDESVRGRIVKTLERIVCQIPEEKSVDVNMTDSAIIKACSCIMGCERLYMGEGLVVPKVGAAMAAMKVRESRAEIVMHLDTSLYGGAKDGMLLTRKAVYFKNTWEDPVRIEWRDIHAVDVSGRDIVFNGNQKFQTAGSNLNKTQVGQLKDALVGLSHLLRGEERT